MKKLAAAIAALLLLPCAAHAQSGPVTPADIAAAKARADQLIRQANAGSFFTNISDGAIPMVRHDRSRLICLFSMDESTSRIVVFDDNSPTRGDDVGCTEVSEGVSSTHYATRYRPAITLQAALDDAVAAIRQRFADATPFPNPVETAADDADSGLPRTLLAHFQVQVNGAPHYTAVRVAEADGWIYKQRITAAVDIASTAQWLADAFWRMGLKGVVGRDKSI